jgi:hypothetical protein
VNDCQTLEQNEGGESYVGCVSEPVEDIDLDLGDGGWVDTGYCSNCDGVYGNFILTNGPTPSYKLCYWYYTNLDWCIYGTSHLSLDIRVQPMSRGPAMGGDPPGKWRWMALININYGGLPTPLQIRGVYYSINSRDNYSVCWQPGVEVIELDKAFDGVATPGYTKACDGALASIATISKA